MGRERKQGTEMSKRLEWCQAKISIINSGQTRIFKEKEREREKAFELTFWLQSKSLLEAQEIIQFSFASGPRPKEIGLKDLFVHLNKKE